MENVQVLVDKLQEQLRQSADPAALLDTVQQLQSLLQAAQRASTPTVMASRPSSKVAVVMPGNNGSRPAVILPMAEKQVEATPEPLPVAKAPVEEEQREEELQKAVVTQDWLQNLMQEIPTLAHQKEIRELNEVMSHQQGSSMNDKLKQHSVEVAEVLTREPVRDLKKAIGINDRFVFVNELFRGDEVMYERSIKTINSFHVLQEAEFWMERELKLKLGWDDSKDVVRHFIQLVRRRFSAM